MTYFTTLSPLVCEKLVKKNWGQLFPLCTEGLKGRNRSTVALEIKINYIRKYFSVLKVIKFFNGQPVLVSEGVFMCEREYVCVYMCLTISSVFKNDSICFYLV